MLNVAVVGVGWWGQTLITLMKKSPKFRVVKGVKRNPATVAEFARAQGVEIISDYAAVLKDPGIEAVVLCTPHTLHTDQIIAAANAGKHVFCEKPLSLTRADVARALDAVNRNKVHLAVGHERRFWTLTKVVSGDHRTTVEYPPSSSVLANLEAFADAVEGRAPYLIPQGEMIATVAALEAIIESAGTGRKVMVQ